MIDDDVNKPLSQDEALDLIEKQRSFIDKRMGETYEDHISDFKDIDIGDKDNPIKGPGLVLKKRLYSELLAIRDEIYKDYINSVKTKIKDKTKIYADDIIDYTAGLNQGHELLLDEILSHSDDIIGREHSIIYPREEELWSYRDKGYNLECQEHKILKWRYLGDNLKGGNKENNSYSYGAKQWAEVVKRNADKHTTHPVIKSLHQKFHLQSLEYIKELWAIIALKLYTKLLYNKEYLNKNDTASQRRLFHKFPQKVDATLDELLADDKIYKMLTVKHMLSIRDKKQPDYIKLDEAEDTTVTEYLYHMSRDEQLRCIDYLDKILLNKTKGRDEDNNDFRDITEKLLIKTSSEEYLRQGLEQSLLGNNNTRGRSYNEK